MLTDRQIIALCLVRNTIDGTHSIMHLARNVEGTKKVIKDALTVADLFLETSNPEQIPNGLISQFQANNQRLQEINDILLDTQYSEPTSGN